MKKFLSKSRLGFTLMEVNLAVFIMAVGVLAMVSLYPLAFRESQQSSDDVAASALADGILSPLAAALSSTNTTWSRWQGIINGTDIDNGLPTKAGWLAYCRGSGSGYLPFNKNQLRTTSAGVVSTICSKLSLPGNENPASAITSIITDFENQHGIVPVLVATYGTIKDQNGALRLDKSRIILCMRAVRRPFTLFSQPIYYTEVHFQGDPNL
jgi:hypothetical protein